MTDPSKTTPSAEREVMDQILEEQAQRPGLDGKRGAPSGSDLNEGVVERLQSRLSHYRPCRASADSEWSVEISSNDLKTVIATLRSTPSPTLTPDGDDGRLIGRISKLRAALAFYADPHRHLAADEGIPDFYRETNFGLNAEEALAEDDAA